MRRPVDRPILLSDVSYHLAKLVGSHRFPGVFLEPAETQADAAGGDDAFRFDADRSHYFNAISKGK